MERSLSALVSLSGRRADKGNGESPDETPGDSTETLRAGDRHALAALFDQHRDRLRRMVELRLEPRL
jgi:hypothetical protein